MRASIVGPEGVRRLLRASGPREMLRRQLGALLENGAKLGPCRLTHAKFTAGGIEAHFDLAIQVRAQSCVTVRPCQVTWELPGRPFPKEAGVFQSVGVPPEISSPFRFLEADIPTQAMRIEVSPFDAKYRWLWRLFEPGYLLE